MSTDGEKRPGPAYVAFPSMKTLLQQLKEHGVPSQIDRSVLGSFSGATQTQLVTALRFLRLITANNTPTPAMRTLVDAVGTDGWAEALKKVMAAYIDILGDIDLTAATPQQVEGTFRDAGLDGSTVDKAMRFFLAGVKEANIPHSPHLGRRRRASGPRRERIVRRIAESGSNNSVVNDHDVDDDDGDDGMMSFPIHIPGKPTGKIVVPKSITTADCKLIEAHMAVISIYASQNSSKLTDAEIAEL